MPKMKSLTIITLFIISISTSCESPPAKQKPSKFHGTYTANIEGALSSIEILATGEIIYKNIPNHHYGNGQTEWELVPPERTLGGIWSLHFSNLYFRFYDNKGDHKFLYPYDVTNNKDAWYIKSSN